MADHAIPQTEIENGGNKPGVYPSAERPSLGPPRIFVEVIREIEGGGTVGVRKEIGVGPFRQARFGMAEVVINQCLKEIEQYGR